MAYRNFSRPSPVTLEMARKGNPRSAARARSDSTRCGSCAASSLVATRIMGFFASSSLNAARSTHTATLLPSGQVLVAAGYYVNGPAWLSSAEVYGSAAGPISLLNPVKLPGGAFQFAFTGASNGTNTVLATTNATLALSNWMVLGAVPEFSPGLFLFSDWQAANDARRFYRIRSP